MLALVHGEVEGQSSTLVDKRVSIVSGLLLSPCLNVLSPPQGVVTEPTTQTGPPSSQDVSGQQQPLALENSSDHAQAYSYQPTK